MVNDKQKNYSEWIQTDKFQYLKAINDREFIILNLVEYSDGEFINCYITKSYIDMSSYSKDTILDEYSKIFSYEEDTTLEQMIQYLAELKSEEEAIEDAERLVHFKLKDIENISDREQVNIEIDKQFKKLIV